MKKYIEKVYDSDSKKKVLVFHSIVGDIPIMGTIWALLEAVLIFISGFASGWHFMNIAPAIDQCNDHIYNEYVVGDGCSMKHFNMTADAITIKDGINYGLNKTRFNPSVDNVKPMDYGGIIK